MLNYAITFFIIAIVAAFLGFTGIAGSATSIAQILFFVFLVLAVISFLTGRRGIMQTATRINIRHWIIVIAAKYSVASNQLALSNQL
jgi:uncharacterized membrane protein YtjA (UPF0391 family)